MRETINRHRVGSRTAVAVVHYMTWVPAGQNRGGSHGLELLDENGVWRCADDNFEDRRHPNAGMARAWAQRRAKALLREHPGAMLSDAKVVVERWDADEFEDDRYGLILDAENVTESEQYGGIGADGSIEWGDPEPVHDW